MKYPIGYNKETRTCIFIEEFNGGASFRMWMNGKKVHVEVFTPDMKRRKEKEVGSHVASLNAYVAEMYARFNDYVKAEVSASAYLLLGSVYLGPFLARYSKLIECAVMDKHDACASTRKGIAAMRDIIYALATDLRSARLMEYTKFELGGVLENRIGASCNISHPPTEKMVEDMSEDMIQHINFNSDIKKVKPNRLFRMDEVDLRKVNTMSHRAPITSKNVIEEMNSMIRGIHSKAPEVKPDRYRHPFGFKMDDMGNHEAKDSELFEIGPMHPIDANVNKLPKKEDTEDVFINPDNESIDSGFFSGNWLND